MEDEAQFRRFLNEAREKALGLADQSHLTIEARNVLKDFIEISHQTERLMGARMDSSGDMRLLTKRHDVLKQEHRQLQNRFDKFKEALTTDLPPILKAITVDATVVAEKGAQLGDSSLQDVSTHIKGSVKKLVELLTKL